MREPIARGVSNYYFARRGNYSRREELRARLGEKADWDINTCTARWSECEWARHAEDELNLMTQFFCGHHPFCRTLNDNALAVALRNLEEGFFLVGITERFAESVHLFQLLLPGFFAHAYR
jgi:hypothetical protein